MIQSPLPIEKIRNQVLSVFQEQSVVISAPTGSGKSTSVPLWFKGRVLVIEPRRVACKSLAKRVSQLEGCELGSEIGFQVRDEKKCTPQTRVLFVTPGIALRNPDLMKTYDTVVFDEFHERRLDTDLLLAFVKKQNRKMIVMSATVAADEIATYLGGIHVHCEIRLFPITVHYLHESHRPGQQVLLPTKKDLEERAFFAIKKAMETPGDILVFLPGKSEIQSLMKYFENQDNVSALPLHGGLSLHEQSKVFDDHPKRKIILSTNVAETSVTVPGVKTVIDSGLVRRTQYHQGRGYLTVLPVAQDSADQRAGRAGRTGPGICYRLWDSKARLQPHTPAEIHRESLVPLVMDACALSSSIHDFHFLSPPKEFAIEEAFTTLEGLGLIDKAQRITAAGEKLGSLPLDPFLGRVLIEAKQTPVFEEVLDLVCCLSVGGPFFSTANVTNELVEDLGCDAIRLIDGFRSSNATENAISSRILSEARLQKKRLQPAFHSETSAQNSAQADLNIQTLSEIAKVILRAAPASAYVARKRKHKTFWSNGGTEISLDERSLCANRSNVDCIAVLSSFAGSQEQGKHRVIATVALPLRDRWLIECGIGQQRVGAVKVKDGVLLAETEFIYAKKSLSADFRIPQGSAAREAFLKLFLHGRLFSESLAIAKQRLTEIRLALELQQSALTFDADLSAFLDIKLEIEHWAQNKLESLGIESGEDLSLLSADDFLPPVLPPEIKYLLERDFPAFVDLGDAYYKTEYNFSRKEVSLFLIRGTKQKPPPASFLPAFPGLRVKIQAGGTMHSVRG